MGNSGSSGKNDFQGIFGDMAKRFLVYICLFILFLPLISTAAPPDDSYPLPLNLTDAFRLALEKNPTLEAGRARQDAAKAIAMQTLKGYLPTVSFDTNYVRFDGSLISDVYVPILDSPSLIPPIVRQDLGPVDAYLSGFQVIQPLINIEAWNARQQANRAITAAGFAVSQGERELALMLIEAYYGVMVAEELLKVEKSAYLAAEKTVRLAESMFDEGLVAPVDVYGARAQMFEFKSRVSSAEGQIAVAMAQLQRIIGLEGDIRITLTDAIPDPPEVMPEKGVTCENIDRRMDIRAQKEILASAEAGVDRANAGYLPRLNVVGRYQWIDQHTFLGSENDLWMVGVNLHWTIFAGMHRSGVIAQAEAKKRRQQAALAELRHAARAEAKSSEAQWHTAMHRWGYSKMSAENAAAALTQTMGRYSEGIDGITELLRARAEDLKAKTLQADARYQAVLAAHRYRLSALAAHPMENLMEDLP